MKSCSGSGGCNLLTCQTRRALAKKASLVYLSAFAPLSAQAELKALLASKTKVIKETELRKSSLEQLEKQLDEFIAVGTRLLVFACVVQVC